jgi:hypothetical protein
MKFSLKSAGRVQELTIIIITVGIVFFVLYAVYKNVSKLGSIRSVRGFNEGFSGTGSRPSLDYSSYPENIALDSKKALLIDQGSNGSNDHGSKVQGSPDAPHCGKVWGLNGLFCQPGGADTLIDVFYSAKSDMTCPGSGYSKGQGNLCLDKTQNKLLTSRGGNADTYDHFKS